jgi:hypothetical protein
MTERKSWRDILPVHPFVAASEEQQIEFFDLFYREVLRRAGRGADRDLNDDSGF